uniref:Uncharacterized protein n=1 Tax=Anguilla anguilla TaxID=7936 RepID=A0A0E9WJX6_ANGAN
MRYVLCSSSPLCTKNQDVPLHLHLVLQTSGPQTYWAHNQIMRCAFCDTPVTKQQISN